MPSSSLGRASPRPKTYTTPIPPVTDPRRRLDVHVVSCPVLSRSPAHLTPSEPAHQGPARNPQASPVRVQPSPVPAHRTVQTAPHPVAPHFSVVHQERGYFPVAPPAGKLGTGGRPPWMDGLRNDLPASSSWPSSFSSHRRGHSLPWTRQTVMLGSLAHPLLEARDLTSRHQDRGVVALPGLRLRLMPWPGAPLRSLGLFWSSSTDL
ncbi:hypothetical protein B0T11DRAFT_107863 [Plectosphaerella cucumerina]|uniref:Uncharacterized protein n=1 Tax=Plectosphaerella cucumerina TaxID=40658 RepID=A0A8K0TBX7_9PEZI|nr:hypothetical protein B0T11DRAFT_107863 [Plectosphaerella cucumerina]